jgi:hypothetical protein
VYGTQQVQQYPFPQTAPGTTGHLPPKKRPGWRIAIGVALALVALLVLVAAITGGSRGGAAISAVTTNVHRVGDTPEDIVFIVATASTPRQARVANYDRRRQLGGRTQLRGVCGTSAPSTHFQDDVLRVDRDNAHRQRVEDLLSPQPDPPPAGLRRDLHGARHDLPNLHPSPVVEPERPAVVPRNRHRADVTRAGRRR